MTDMSESAVRARIEEVSRLAVERRRALAEAVDMSAEAITARIEEVSRLRDLCLRLGAAGRAAVQPDSSEE